MLLFDMDGTLIDSNGIWKDVDTEFLARRGLPYTQAYYEGVAHTIFPLAAKFTKEFCHLPESEEEIMAEWICTPEAYRKSPACGRFWSGCARGASAWPWSPARCRYTAGRR